MLCDFRPVFHQFRPFLPQFHFRGCSGQKCIQMVKLVSLRLFTRQFFLLLLQECLRICQRLIPAVGLDQKSLILRQLFGLFLKAGDRRDILGLDGVVQLRQKILGLELEFGGSLLHQFDPYLRKHLRGDWHHSLRVSQLLFIQAAQGFKVVGLQCLFRLDYHCRKRSLLQRTQILAPVGVAGILLTQSAQQAYALRVILLINRPTILLQQRLQILLIGHGLP